MNKTPIFSQKLLLVVVAAAIAAFTLSLYLMSQDGYGVNKAGTNSFSRSAVGYEGLAHLLERLGIKVVRSRRGPSHAARNGVLIFAEPRLNRLSYTALPSAKRILLVLPKWSTKPGGPEGWVKTADPMTLYTVRQTLRLALDDATPKRVRKQISWQENKIGVEPPSFAKDTQLIQAKTGIRPLIAAKEGILLGEVVKDGKRIWVLSDPDMISNRAFGKDGKTIAFAVALVKVLSRGGPVVFDETIHGYSSPTASLAQTLFEFPYNMLALQILIGAAFLLWGAMGRFGVPETPPEPLAAGKKGLVSNVARLMKFAGHEKLIVRRYIDNSIREAALHLRAPKDLSQSERVEWLQRVGTSRGVSLDLQQITMRAAKLIAGWRTNISDLSTIAQDMYRWKQEIVDGSSEYSRRYRRGTARGSQGDRRSG
jgi:hypothetical protein